MQNLRSSITTAVGHNIPPDLKAVRRLALNLALLFPGFDVDVIESAIQDEIKKRSKAS